jgi:large subunit ribosomal protein L17
MNHLIFGRKLGRDTSHRLALLGNLAISLIASGQIKTTLSKAKFVRPYVEKLITKSKKNTLANRRYLLSLINHKPSVEKLLNDIGPRMLKRPGGYTRILKAGFRYGDAAPVAYIQFVDHNNNKAKENGK